MIFFEISKYEIIRKIFNCIEEIVFAETGDMCDVDTFHAEVALFISEERKAAEIFSFLKKEKFIYSFFIRF